MEMVRENGLKVCMATSTAVHPAWILCDLLHPEGAEQMDETGYLSDFYAGMPVITRNRMGKGYACFVAASSNEEFYRDFLGDICAKCHIRPVLETPEGVEVTSRQNEKETLFFVLNHNAADTKIKLPFSGVDLISGVTYPDGFVLL